MAASDSRDDYHSSFLSLKLLNRSNLHIGDVGFIKEGSNLLNLQLDMPHMNKRKSKRKNGEQGWRSGESTRLSPMWPEFDSRTRSHMWVEFVVGSRPSFERFFSGYSGFPLSTKINTSKFQFDLESVPN